LILALEIDNAKDASEADTEGDGGEEVAVLQEFWIGRVDEESENQGAEGYESGLLVFV
jgi:hypothetical protein